MAKVDRICLTGPESTGKSELAARLARELDAPLVPEFARDYAAAVARELTSDDVTPIARGQMANEDRALSEGARLLVLDTDLISTIVYSRFYYGACPQWVVEEALRRRSDLYLLLDVDLPWMADPVRDARADRDEMFMRFHDALREFGATFQIVSGEGEERLQRARELIAGVAGDGRK